MIDQLDSKLNDTARQTLLPRVGMLDHEVQRLAAAIKTATTERDEAREAANVVQARLHTAMAALEAAQAQATEYLAKARLEQKRICKLRVDHENLMQNAQGAFGDCTPREP